MPSFQYSPGPDDPEVVRTLNRTFKAGESFDLDEKDPLYNKLANNPTFRGQGTDQEPINKQQAELNASAREDLGNKRRQNVETARRARSELAAAEAEERRLGLTERALGELSPAEIRAMDQVRGTRGEDGPLVPGEEGYQSDGVTGAGVIPRTGATGSDQLEPDNKAKAGR